MNQRTLDRLSAILGSIAVVSSALGGTGMINTTWAESIAGISGAIVVALARMPASTPTQQPQQPK